MRLKVLFIVLYVKKVIFGSYETCDGLSLGARVGIAIGIGTFANNHLDTLSELYASRCCYSSRLILRVHASPPYPTGQSCVHQPATIRGLSELSVWHASTTAWLRPTFQLSTAAVSSAVISCEWIRQRRNLFTRTSTPFFAYPNVATLKCIFPSS